MAFVIVGVIVAVPLIVAALVNGNDTVAVIDTGDARSSHEATSTGRELRPWARDSSAPPLTWALGSSCRR